MIYDRKLTGKNIKMHRIKNGLTIEEFAAIIGLSSAFVGLVERGQRSTQLENVLKMCKIFNVTVEELIYGSGGSAKIISESNPSPREKKVNNLFVLTYSLTEVQLEFLMSMSRSLKSFNGDPKTKKNDDDVKYFNRD